MRDPDTPQQLPEKIDIYVDGSFLYPGKLNVPASGWGAAVIEHYADNTTNTWLPSGPCDDSVKQSNDAEMEAAIKALKAVRIRHDMRPEEGPMPAITLHSDQIDWNNKMERIRQKGARGNDKKILELMEAMEGLPVTLKYVSHDKMNKHEGKNDDPVMELPHKLAAQAAWLQRLEKQDGEFRTHSEGTRKIPKESWQDFVNNLYPIDSKNFTR